MISDENCDGRRLFSLCWIMFERCSRLSDGHCRCSTSARGPCLSLSGYHFATRARWRHRRACIIHEPTRKAIQSFHLRIHTAITIRHQFNHVSDTKIRPNCCTNKQHFLTNFVAFLIESDVSDYLQMNVKSNVFVM